MPGATAFGTEFLINTTTTNSQSEPTITALADGRFVVAWTDGGASGGDTSSDAVRAQVFNADGSKSGAEFLVNTTTTNGQSEPTITALADGRFVVAWTDGSASGGDTSGCAVRAQVFNADGSTSGAEFLVNTTTTSGQFEPTITALADGRFVVAWTDSSRAAATPRAPPCGRRCSTPTAASRGPSSWSTPRRRMTSPTPPSRRWPTAASWWRGRMAVRAAATPRASPCGRRCSTPTAARQGPSSWSTPPRRITSPSPPSRRWPTAASWWRGRMAVRAAATPRAPPCGRRCSTPTAASRGPSSWSTPPRRIASPNPPSRRWPTAASWWRGRMAVRAAATPRAPPCGRRCSTPTAASRGPSSWSTPRRRMTSANPPSRRWPTAASWWRGRMTVRAAATPRAPPCAGRSSIRARRR